MQAFGNSIIEIIVGKSEQTDFLNRADNNESNLRYMKSTSFEPGESFETGKVLKQIEKSFVKPITGGI